jgi:hypothetical protein
MRLPGGKLQKDIMELLQWMTSGAVLTYSSKASGVYILTFPDGTKKQLVRTAPRAAWDQGYIESNSYGNGVTTCVITVQGWVALLSSGEDREVTNV